MPSYTNHLNGEKSPYLKQHVNNPVDWYPWTPATLEKAVKEDKPIFLSIGYSTCHWCHVMAKESFENEKVAQVLNDTFICIKVDREERPDIDMIYMQVCQMMNGNGGWPLNVILTPKLKPVVAATYLSPANLIGLSQRIKTLWTTDRQKVLNNAEVLNTYLKKKPEKRDDNFLAKLDQIAWKNLRREFDEKNGGFGTAPKFPVPQRLLFLLRYWYTSKNHEVMKVIETTLYQMRCGGIYDQVGGGFHRYSIDAAWKVPHFEKMLYDQALISMAYTEAAAATGNQTFSETARDIINYTLRRLQSPQGTFYAAEDANEQYYLWSTNELRTILSPSEFDIATKIYNINPEGNFTPESGNRTEKLNIPYQSAPLSVTAAKISSDPNIIINLDKYIRMQMLKLRARRPAPHRDEKIITSANGLMIAALAKAGRAFDDQQYLSAAVLAADDILLHHVNADQSLTRCIIDGQPNGKAVLEDYAYLIWGFIELYEAVFDPKYLAAAIHLSEYANAHFTDTENGGYLEIADNTENILFRPRNYYDSATPSGSSVMMYDQLRLASLTGSVEYAHLAERNALSMANAVNHSPQNCAMVLNGWLFARYPAWELVVVGKLNDPDTKNMLKLITRPFFPFKSIRFCNAADESDPNNQEFKMVNGTCTVYICRNQSCQAPVNSVDEVVKILNLKSPLAGTGIK